MQSAATIRQALGSFGLDVARIQPVAVSNPNLTTAAGAGIDLSPATASIEQAGGAVQAAVNVLGTAMVRQLDGIEAALNTLSEDLGTRIARVESGNLTSRIGMAQGAASVLA